MLVSPSSKIRSGPRTQWAPLLLVGRGWGWGVVSCGSRLVHTPTPALSRSEPPEAGYSINPVRRHRGSAERTSIRADVAYWALLGPREMFDLSPQSDRYCCKSLFALVIKNSPGCRRDLRVKMWGTSSPEDKLTGGLGNVIDIT